MTNSRFQRIWLPGFMFQSVLIGGGYATGRELVEFFLSAGPVAGILGMLLSTFIFSVLCALSFELARLSCSYDYRSFFRQLLGRGWILYEIAYLILGLLIMAVIGAAAGEIVSDRLNISSTLGTLGLMILICLLVFFGTKLIERVLAGWSFLLYATFAIFVTWYLTQFHETLFANLSLSNVGTQWVSGGIKYAGYNIAILPAILFCAKHMQSRRDAITAGILAGPIAMIPALLIFTTMIASYPEVLQAAVPSDFMMQRLNAPIFGAVFYVVIFGTFVETGAVIIHAINERIAGLYREKNKNVPDKLRLIVAVIAIVTSVVLADTIGLVTLISQGYSALTWMFIVVFALPLLTVGVWKIFSGKSTVTKIAVTKESITSAPTSSHSLNEV
jgi:uncharacterized membrane protein YkvI